jgi:hypothetical protein
MQFGGWLTTEENPATISGEKDIPYITTVKLLTLSFLTVWIY